MTQYNIRRSAGAVLGLIAASIFVLVAIGAFMYYASTLIGGNNELNRASDAGILNVVKEAMVQPAVALNDPSLPGQGTFPYNDFAYFIPDQNIGGTAAIDILTYNRCVAQAVMVGLNAQRLNTTLGYQHAQLVCQAVNGLGQRLQQLFADGALNGYYDQAANQNTLNMLGNVSGVIREGNLTQAYINAGRPSNIFFYADVVDPITVINDGQPTTVLNQVPQNLSAADPQPSRQKAAANDPYFQSFENVSYASGYSTITLMPGTAYSSQVCFVPNNPQDTPHAIDKQRFAADINPAAIGIISSAPPNSFRAHSVAETNSTGLIDKRGDNFVGTLSCAVIGCGDALAAFPGFVGGGGGPDDQAARIPGGFVRLYNLPGYEQQGTFAVGPVPGMAGASSAGFDGSGVILNNQALGDGRHIIFLSPPQGYPHSLVLDNIVFTEIPANLPYIQQWIAFNTSSVPATSSEYNADVINGQHRDPNQDPFGYGKSAQYIANGQNPTFSPLRQGTKLGQLAKLSNLIYGDAYLNVDCSNLDGKSKLVDTAGHVYTAQNLMDMVVNAAGANLNEMKPVPVDLTTPADHQTWSWVEAVKYYVIHTWVADMTQGHERVQVPQQLLETGLKYIKNWDKAGNRIPYASPNKGGTQTSSQIMQIATPYVLLNGINEQINQKGGYQAGQVTYANYVGSITNQVRMINPKWSENDVTNALNSVTLAPGQLKWLRDDGNGNLTLANTCPQDTGVGTDANLSNSTGTNDLVDFATLPGQDIETLTWLINTAEFGDPTAVTADAGLEKQPWTKTTGSAAYEQGAILYKSSGYNNLLGEVDFYSRPSGNLNILFANPN